MFSSATVPRTKARQPSAGGGSAASKRSSSPYASECGLDLAAFSRALISTVTPASAAKGRQRPSL